MIDWLRGAGDDPRIELAGRSVPIAVRRNRRARRLTLRLAPDGSEVRLTVPGWCRTADAVAFAHARAAWLDAQLVKVPTRCPVEPGGTLRYRGQPVAVDWQAHASRRPVLREAGLRIGGPAQGLERRITRWLEGEALRLCAVDLAYFCARAGRPVPDLRLSRAQRRWGSCSTAGAVRINWRLVQAPDAVRRSVVAHEVAHLVHFDHSPAFHALLADIFDDDLPAADAWLKREGRSLYAQFG